MQTSPSHSPPLPYAALLNHDRIFRACVLNAVPIPAQTLAVLESRGVDVAELENRLLNSIGYTR